MIPPRTMILFNCASFIWKFIKARRNKECLWKNYACRNDG
jgi:hypothetical protein